MNSIMNEHDCYIYHMSLKCLKIVFLRENVNISVLLRTTLMDIIMLCYYTIIDLCWGWHGVLLNSKRNVDWRGAEAIWLSLLFNSTPCLPKHKSTILLL